MNAKLQASLDSEKRGFEDKQKRELGALKEQLQVIMFTDIFSYIIISDLTSGLGINFWM